jgi:cytidylate kinase
MVITIDGPAKSGKSRAARLLADALGFELLNTGAMYRAAGLFLRRAGVNLEDGPRRDKDHVAELVAPFVFEPTESGMLLNGEDFTAAIADPVSRSGEAASLIGEFREVRTKLKAEQRRLASGKDMICEGRDQGTAVFPDAAVKFFLTASPEVRALRQAGGDHAADLIQIAKDIATRDERDANRRDELGPLDPLVPAADAVTIDTSNHTEAETLAALLGVVEQWRSKA